MNQFSLLKCLLIGFLLIQAALFVTFHHHTASLISSDAVVKPNSLLDKSRTKLRPKRSKLFHHSIDDVPTVHDDDRYVQDEIIPVVNASLKRTSNGDSYNKTILMWTNMRHKRFNDIIPCDIPCEYTNELERRLEADGAVYKRPGYVYQKPLGGDKFTILLQMEGFHYYPIPDSFPQDYDLENSFHWRSPILKPVFEFIAYHGATDVQKQTIPAFNTLIDGATFTARHCHSKNHREVVTQELMDAGIRVDALSTCLHNTKKPLHDDKIQMIRPYKFHLAFENGSVDDYITEKVYDAFLAGIVPVYLGASNINLNVPDGSIINVADFESTAELADHLNECMKNETLYNTYHEWRFRPLPPWFLKRFDYTKASTECRTCRYMHAMFSGWDWDKTNQRGVPKKKQR